MPSACDIGIRRHVVGPVDGVRRRWRNSEALICVDSRGADRNSGAGRARIERYVSGGTTGAGEYRNCLI